MNLYFLLEDSKSALKVFPAWFSYFIPKFTRVKNINELRDNNYIMQSGMGYPQIKNHLQGAIETINSYPDIPLGYLILILDADDHSIDEVKKDMEECFAVYGNLRCPHEIIVMKKCFETWLLGNLDYFPEVISEQFKPFINHFDVSVDDPELMIKSPEYPNSTSIYHAKYAIEMLRKPFNPKGFNYSKRKPGKVIDEEYFNGLLKRIKSTNHIGSFQYFIDMLYQLTSTQKRTF